MRFTPAALSVSTIWSASSVLMITRDPLRGSVLGARPENNGECHYSLSRMDSGAPTSAKHECPYIQQAVCFQLLQGFHTVTPSTGKKGPHISGDYHRHNLPRSFFRELICTLNSISAWCSQPHADDL